MKFSLNLQDDNHPLLKAKLPLSIFDQPFTSMFTTTTNSLSDFSFSLSTNLPSGPSFRVTYTPCTTTSISPISLSLKSGLGLFGSPHNSPLVFSAHFAVSTASPNVILPTFSIHLKPQFGHFSLRKKTLPSSNANPSPNLGLQSTSASHFDLGSPSNSELENGFATDGLSGWQELKLEPCNSKEKEGFANPRYNDPDVVYADNNGIGFFPGKQLVWRDRKKGGFLGGVSVKARTVLPVTKRILVNLRWGVNLPGDLGAKMPYLTVNKIGLERVEEVKDVKKESSDNKGNDLELLRGMCFWMKRDLEMLEKENRDMKQSLEDARLGVLTRNFHGESNAVRKREVPTSSDSFHDFEQWRGKKHNEKGSVKREPKKNGSQVTDLETELQRAIKAASS